MKRQTGQAIAEFNVSAAFLLVPLFIMVPLLGKYIDMKHASVQSARYMAWEQTVWAEPEVEPEDAGYVAVKRTIVTALETRERFYGGVAEDGLGDSVINPLWNDRGQKIVESQDDVLLSYANEGNEDVLAKSRTDSLHSGKRSKMYQAAELQMRGMGLMATGLSKGAIYGFQSVIDEINTLLGTSISVPFPKVPELGENLQYKGYYRTDASIKLVEEPFKKLFKTEPLPFVSRAGVLSDSWVVADNEQFAEWSKGLVPVAPLEDMTPSFKKIVSYTLPGTKLSIAPELDTLEFGYINTDPLSDSSRKLSQDDCPGGLCSFE